MWIRRVLVGLAVASACGLAAIQAQTPAPAKPPSAPQPERFGIGRAAAPEEIAALDIDIGPDGSGLPPGSATSADGAPIYAAKCASCHGPTGKEGPNDRLA